MKQTKPLKACVLALALGAFSLVGGANAQDDDGPDARDVMEGIVGEVIGGAMEEGQTDEEDVRCDRLQQQCDAGSDQACNDYEMLCE